MAWIVVAIEHGAGNKYSLHECDGARRSEYFDLDKGELNPDRPFTNRRIGMVTHILTYEEDYLFNLVRRQAGDSPQFHMLLEIFINISKSRPRN